VVETSGHPALYVALHVVVASGLAALIGLDTWYLGLDHIGVIAFSTVLAIWSFGVVNLICQALELLFWISRILPIHRRAAS
jgi:hypothetical protein